MLTPCFVCVLFYSIFIPLYQRPACKAWHDQGMESN
jgi:hypothetical protein